LRNWIALNSENYLKYKSIDGIVERITFLEKILIANLLSFAKGMNIEIKEQIECKIIKMDEPHMIKVKDIKMMTFDLDFKTNLSLPDYMGIGKHASIGFGTVVRMHNK
jgi:CRISPR/Cas system endoribonuclease Cas6 (RAMP superfamily)